MDKFAVIADIHSNDFALEAILEDIRSREIQTVINLGDIFYGPIDPKRTFEIVKENDFITIQGNQDRYLYEATSEKIQSNPTLEFVLDAIGNEGLKWLQDKPFTFTMDNKIFCCHGSPRSDTIYLLEDVSSGGPVLKSDTDIRKELKKIEAGMILCAHTHIPRTITVSTKQMVLNPGSVGMPAYEDDVPNLHKMETGSPHSRYAIFSEENGKWKTEHIQIPYKVEAAAVKAEKNNRYDWANILRTGRA